MFSPTELCAHTRGLNNLKRTTPPDEIVGQSIRVLIPPDRQNEEAEILARLNRGERLEHYETVRRKKNSQLCEISLTVSPIRDAEGRLLGASKIARDITERNRAQRALFESQEQWRVTLESIGDAVVATDRSSLVTFANSVALQLLGRSKASMIGRPLANSLNRRADLSLIPWNE